MTKKLKIVYNKEKCIGAFTCTNIAPAFFKQEDNKANLAESQTEGEYQTRVVECDEKTSNIIIEAAEKCPANVIGVTDLTSKEKIVDTTIKKTNECREIEAVYDDAKEFVLDEKGYFLIRTMPEKMIIEVGFCGKRNTVEIKISGKTPIEIYQTILRERIIDRPDHAAYLGRELQKAFSALQLGVPYVQDDPLNYGKGKQQR
jgi:ferredoxin